MTDLTSLAALDAEIYAELGAVGWVSDATHRARGATATTTVQAMISASYQVAGEWVQLGAQTRTARLLRSQIVTARRQVPVGSVLANDVLTLPGGETVAVDQIDTTGPVPTIPSEFADAVQV